MLEIIARFCFKHYLILLQIIALYPLHQKVLFEWSVELFLLKAERLVNFLVTFYYFICGKTKQHILSFVFSYICSSMFRACLQDLPAMMHKRHGILRHA